MTNYTAMSIDQLVEYRDRCSVFRKEREHVDAIIRHRQSGAQGFFATLTDEQRKAAIEYRGPDHHGAAAPLAPEVG